MTSPLFVDDNPSTVLQSVLSDFSNFTGKTLEPAQPEYLFCAAVAYRESLLLSRINAAGKSMLLQFAVAPVLDYIVALVGITRLQAQKAVCTIQFELVEGHGNIIIPSGTRVRSTDGLAVFETQEDTAVASDTNTVHVDVICQESGKAGNNYAIGTITEIMDPQPYISTASNIDVTAGGSDQETDEQLRERAYEAPSQYSVAGSRDAYKFHTKSVSPLIIDVSVLTHTEDASIPYGEVRIYPLLEGGNVANSALISAIETKLNLDSIKPINDTVIVLTPAAINFQVVIEVIKISTASNSDIESAITLALNNYRQKKIEQLGLDIVKSEILKLCLVDGVYDVRIILYNTSGKTLTDGNYIISGNEFGYLSDFRVEFIGTNNG